MFSRGEMEEKGGGRAKAIAGVVCTTDESWEVRK
jgi:hypothetical protein